MKPILTIIGLVVLAGVFVGGVAAYRALSIPSAAKDPSLVSSGEAVFDHAPFDALLKAHVSADGQVDYTGLKAKEPELDAYLKALADADVSSLGSDEQLALFINAYNAFTLKLILEHLPLSSIRDTPDPWGTARWVVGGKTYTLGKESGENKGIEHNILRGNFADPRIHFAINCASASCPELTPWAYRGDRIDAQLDRQTRAFAANRKHVRIEDGKLKLSQILNWYGADFSDPTRFKGAAESVTAYVKKYAPNDIADFIDSNPEIEFITYDWSLNGK